MKMTDKELVDKLAELPLMGGDGFVVSTNEERVAVNTAARFAKACGKISFVVQSKKEVSGGYRITIKE